MSETLIQTVDLGSIIGPQGPEGPPGKNGDSLEFKWCGTKLGIRIKGQEQYTYVDLKGTPGTPGRQGEKGEKGEKGENGKSLEFKWCGTKLGIKIEGECRYTYVDLKGPQGNPGIIGPPGKQGKEGKRGPQGKSLEFKWNGTELGIRIQGENDFMFIDLQGPPGPEGPKGTTHWCDLEGIPSTFPPNEHTHPIPEIDLSNYYKKNEFEINPIGNTPVKRDSHGGIHAEKLTTNVADVTHFDGGIVFRTSNVEGSNDLKVCNNPTAFKAWLNLGVKKITEDVSFTTDSYGSHQSNYTIIFNTDITNYSYLQISGIGFKTFVVIPKTEGYTKLNDSNGPDSVAIFIPISNGFLVNKNGIISVNKIVGIKYIEA